MSTIELRNRRREEFDLINVMVETFNDGDSLIFITQQSDGSCVGFFKSDLDRLVELAAAVEMESVGDSVEEIMSREG